MLTGRFLGGSADDYVTAIAPHPGGGFVVVGGTSSPSFPVTPGAYDTTCGTNGLCNGGDDAFVARIDATGRLVFSTFLGGGRNGLREYATDVAVDASGNIIVVGQTDVTGSDFPIVNGFSGSGRGWIAKLSADGRQLLSSSLFAARWVNSVAIDGFGSVYVVGQTNDSNFALVNPFQTSRPDLENAFVMRLAPSLQSIELSSYLGGSCDDEAFAVTVGADHAAYVTGTTCSTNFPFAGVERGSGGGFVARVSRAGALTMSRLLMGATYAVLAAGNDAIVGMSGGRIARITSAGSMIQSAGPGNLTMASVFEIERVSGNHVCATGSVQAATAGSGAQRIGGGGGDDVVLMCFDASSLIASQIVLIGGGGTDAGNGMAFQAGVLAVGGRSTSADFPVTEGAYSGRLDGVVTLLSLADGPGPPAGAPGAPGNVTASVSGNIVIVSWQAPTSGGPATRYVVEAGLSPGSSNLGRYDVGPLTAVSGTLPAGTYYVRVRAANQSGEGPPSADTQFTIGSTVTRPSGLTVTASGTSATFRWTGGSSAHRLEAGPAPGSNAIGLDVPAGVTALTIPNIPRGTYYVRVRASANGMLSDASNEVALTIP